MPRHPATIRKTVSAAPTAVNIASKVLRFTIHAFLRLVVPFRVSLDGTMVTLAMCEHVHIGPNVPKRLVRGGPSTGVDRSPWRPEDAGQRGPGRPQPRDHAVDVRTGSPGSRPLERSDEFGRTHRPGEHRVVVGEGVLVLLDGGRSDAVVQGDDLVAVLVARSHGRFDAAVGQEPSEGDGGDALAPKDEVEIGAGEGVQTSLALDDDVAFLRGQFVHDCGAPGSLDERVAVHDALEDPVGVRTDLVVSLVERDGSVHDGGTGPACRIDDVL